MYSILFSWLCLLRTVVPSVMSSQAAQMKKVMPAPIKNILREQPISMMITLGKSKSVKTCTISIYICNIFPLQIKGIYQYIAI